MNKRKDYRIDVHFKLKIPKVGVSFTSIYKFHAAIREFSMAIYKSVWMCLLVCVYVWIEKGLAMTIEAI